MHRSPAFPFRVVVTGLLLCTPLALTATRALAQAAPAAAAPATRVLGTVKAVSSSALTVTKDDGSIVTVTLADTVRVQQLPPGSTDIKTAQSATQADIAEGDRVLIAAHPGDAGALAATRVVLMKSGAIAQSNAARQADWQKRGSGGLVSSVDPAAKTIVIASGTKKTTVQTSDRTIFRRYAPGSVKFEDAKVGTLADISPGDQLRVRGSKDVDTGAVAADEVVSGAFRNVSGTVVSIDAALNTLTLKDLATKKNVVVVIGADSDLRNLPPEMAARFAARARGASSGIPAAAGATVTGTGGAGRPAGSPPMAAPNATASTAGGADTAAAAAPSRTRYGAGAGGSANGDLSQVVPRLPKTTLAALKPGEAIMIVGSGSSTAGAPVTAITLLSGVEPLLAASPEGSSGFNLSPWSLGGGGGEAAAAGGTQ